MSEAFSMEEGKRRLINLKEHMSDANDQVVAFGRFLAEYLNSQLVPQGFVMQCELALYDLQVGKNGFTKERIQGSLVGYPPMIYALLRMEIPRIAAAVFPPEFANGVKACLSAIDENFRRQQA